MSLPYDSFISAWKISSAQLNVGKAVATAFSQVLTGSNPSSYIQAKIFPTVLTSIAGFLCNLISSAVGP